MKSIPAVFVLCVILVSLSPAQITLVPGRLNIDVLVWTNAAWRWAEALGFTRSEFSFYRFGAPIGLTGYVTEEVSFRTSFDAGWFQGALDLYADFRWPSGFGLRMGQFVAPVGIEALTEPKKLKFIEYSLVKGSWKPLDPRDAGLMLTYEDTRLVLAVAVLNGNGRGAWLQDDNRWKDFCGRLAFLGWDSAGLVVAARGYYGRTGTEGSYFWNRALEFSFQRNSWGLAGEVQQSNVETSFYAQTSYRLNRLLEPVGRLQASFAPGSIRNIGATVGMNFLVREDNVKVMLNFDYRRQGAPGVELDYTNYKVLLQLQLGL